MRVFIAACIAAAIVAACAAVALPFAVASERGIPGPLPPPGARGVVVERGGQSSAADTTVVSGTAPDGASGAVEGMRMA
jgi:hypothetical protein